MQASHHCLLSPTYMLSKHHMFSHESASAKHYESASGKHHMMQPEISTSNTLLVIVASCVVDLYYNLTMPSCFRPFWASSLSGSHLAIVPFHTVWRPFAQCHIWMDSMDTLQLQCSLSSQLLGHVKRLRSTLLPFLFWLISCHFLSLKLEGITKTKHTVLQLYHNCFHNGCSISLWGSV